MPSFEFLTNVPALGETQSGRPNVKRGGRRDMEAFSCRKSVNLGLPSPRQEGIHLRKLGRSSRYTSARCAAIPLADSSCERLLMP